MTHAPVFVWRLVCEGITMAGELQYAGRQKAFRGLSMDIKSDLPWN